MRGSFLLTAAAAFAISHGAWVAAEPVSATSSGGITTQGCADDRRRPGCGRVALALVGGFSDITRGGHRAKFDGTRSINASHPLTRAWVRVTSKSLRKHVREPLAEAYASAADVFVLSLIHI